MRKAIYKLMTIAVCMLLIFANSTFLVYADSDSQPDFYVVVTSDSESINFRAEAGTMYDVFGQIPNGTELYITDLAYNMKDQFLFGKTIYNGITGWVSLRQTSILKGNNYGFPDYYATVAADAGVINCRSGAGMEYGVVMEIPNGTQLHITDLVYNAGDGFFWGLTSYSGYSGWVSVRQTNIRRDYGNTVTSAGSYAEEYETSQNLDNTSSNHNDTSSTAFSKASTWKDAYQKVLDATVSHCLSEEHHDLVYAYYFLYDIDEDDIPEMVLYDGDWVAATAQVNIYRFADGEAVDCGIATGSPDYYRLYGLVNEPGLLQVWAKQGIWTIGIVDLNGSSLEYTELNSNTSQPGEYPSVITEFQEPQHYSLDDYSGLNWTENPDFDNMELFWNYIIK